MARGIERRRSDNLIQLWRLVQLWRLSLTRLAKRHKAPYNRATLLPRHRFHEVPRALARSAISRDVPGGPRRRGVPHGARTGSEPRQVLDASVQRAAISWAQSDDARRRATVRGSLSADR